MDGLGFVTKRRKLLIAAFKGAVLREELGFCGLK
jgi:hypothetical protein